MNNFYRNCGKRILDIVLSFVAIIILSPAVLIIAILVRTKLGKPIIFSQQRPGKNDKKFRMYKFRTMTDSRDEIGELQPDSIRLTKFGRALRATSLDEIPGLWNVLIGDMSIVGPRPLLVDYLSLYDSEQRRRHEVRPGLTGLAQVNGRNTLTWKERFKFDLQYIDNLSLKQDIIILLKTIAKVIIKEGISSETSETMEAFKGNGNDHN